MAGEPTETDRFGNPVCGRTFMAGTICSDAPGHDGPHSAVCQKCRGDWVTGTCQCDRVLVVGEGFGAHLACPFCGADDVVRLATERVADRVWLANAQHGFLDYKSLDVETVEASYECDACHQDVTMPDHLA